MEITVQAILELFPIHIICDLYQFDSIQDFWVKRYKKEIVVIPSVSLILLNVCAWTKTGQQDISFSMS